MKFSYSQTAFFLGIGLLLFTNFLFAQTRPAASITGKLTDSLGQHPVAHATISLVKDSMNMANAASDKDGFFELTRLDTGHYVLYVNIIGYRTLRREVVLVAPNSRMDLGNLKLFQGNMLIDEVMIEGQAPIVVRGDTTIFNASQFKTYINDDVEALLKLLPGFEIDEEGNIKAHGKAISRLTVEGKDFFGGDPKFASKNLTADIIKSVELIDDQTEMAKNTGIDDGERQKVVNLVLKDDKKNGWFGNAGLTGGTQSRYSGNLNANHFNKSNQFSLVVSGNNVNEGGYGSIEINGISIDPSMLSGMAMGSGGGIVVISGGSGGMMMGGMDGLLNGAAGGGVSTSTSYGVNFSQDFGKNGQIKLNSSYRLSNSDRSYERSSFMQEPLNNEILQTDRENSGSSGADNHNFTMRLAGRLDSVTNFTFEPRISYTSNTSLSRSLFNTVDEQQNPINSGNQYSETKNTNPNLAGNLSFNRRFPRLRSTLALMMSGNYTDNGSRTLNESLTRYLLNDQLTDSVLNQDGSNENKSKRLNTTLTYVSMIDSIRNIMLNIKQAYNVQNSISNQLTMEYNPVSGLYDVLMPAFSNDFDNYTANYQTGIGLSRNTKLWTTNVNMELVNMVLTGIIDNVDERHQISRNNWVLTPNVSIAYRQPSGASIRLSLSKNANLPSVSNLQPVLNNQNPLHIREGNPDLKLTEHYRSNLSYDHMNRATNLFMNINASYSYTNNAITTFATVDPDSRIQTSRPVNINGNQQANIYSNINIPFKKLKGLNANVNIGGNSSKNLNFINGQENSVFQYSLNSGLGLRYFKNKIDANLHTSLAFNDSKNTIQERANQQYYHLSNRLTFNYRPFGKMRINFTGNRSGYLGNTQFDIKDVYLLNASMEYYFLKNNALTAGLSGFDLLNQNASVQRSMSASGGVEQFSTNNVTRYFSLRLNYRLQRIGGGGNFGRSGGMSDIMIY